MDIKCSICGGGVDILQGVIVDWNYEAEPIKKDVCFKCLLKRSVS
jgi:hypothetical protein